MVSMVIEARRLLEGHRAALEQRLRGTGGAAAERELAETNAAIDRIEIGIYGRCEVCGAAIGRQRLLALPAARFCLACSPARRS